MTRGYRIPMAVAVDRFPFIRMLAERPGPFLVVSVVPLDAEFNAGTLIDKEDHQHYSHWRLFVVDCGGILTQVNMQCGHHADGGVFTNTGATLQDNDPIYNSCDEGETIGEALAREFKGTPEYVVLVEESNPRHEPESWTSGSFPRWGSRDGYPLQDE